MLFFLCYTLNCCVALDSNIFYSVLFVAGYCSLLYSAILHSITSYNIISYHIISYHVHNVELPLNQGQRCPLSERQSLLTRHTIIVRREITTILVYKKQIN